VAPLPVPFSLMWTCALALFVFVAPFNFLNLLKGREITNFLADISYPIYIARGVFGYAAFRVVAEFGLAAWLCAMIVSITVATAIHFVIEMPPHRMRRQRVAKAKYQPPCAPPQQAINNLE
jgi:peptidoglycan/LPS O-acetylase OafA/YrhL